MAIRQRGSPVDDTQVPVLIGITCMFLALCSIAISLRWLVRRMRKTRLELDDYLCFAAYILFVAFATTTFILAANGLGRRSAFVAALPNTRDRNIAIRNITLAQQLIHLFTITFVKLSILFLYRRIFTHLFTWFRVLWFGCVAMTLVYLAIYIILVPLQGYPCPLGGPGLDCPFPPPAEKFFAPGGAGNASMDLVILLLPVCVVWKLQMSQQNKSALIGIFLLGSAAVVVSFVRVPYMQNYYAKPDPTYDQVRPVLLGMAESGTAIICACLPVLRPLLSGKAYRSIFSKTGSSYVNPDWSLENSHGSSQQPMWKTSEATSVATDASVIELSDMTNVAHTKSHRLDGKISG